MKKKMKKVLLWAVVNDGKLSLDAGMPSIYLTRKDAHMVLWPQDGERIARVEVREVRTR